MRIKEILNEELKSLNRLLGLLDKQFKLIMKKDIFGLEEIVDEIKLCNKGEVERRKISNGNSMRELIEKLDDMEADNIYREIKKTLHSLKLQKETNEMLIRQGLSFNQLINASMALMSQSNKLPKEILSILERIRK
ncbi:flagellar export chaperone FlgN [Clostridium thermobutyricum]|uniref:FlgN protein n=1 Tax=Clostridium thermobutyricum DSM 4928 TaxID=1121339 RepID=A0A1V4SN94_9CLOT|nr:flagellar export chaperone FlgN [Clostridium thermobutyricum]OPX45342.1 FlgN protein [Clostridium thermobutyricum DSM 4928]